MVEYPLNERKSVAALLYICKTLGGVWDKYSLLKILYFAEKKHLVKYGRPITGDKIIAMDYGPVPSFSYDRVKDKVFAGQVLFEHKEYAVAALADPNMDYLSESDIECLDESILENRNLGFYALKTKSHDAAYDIARQKGNNSIISYKDIARAEGANEELISYICDQIEMNEW